MTERKGIPHGINSCGGDPYRLAKTPALPYQSRAVAELPTNFNLEVLAHRRRTRQGVVPRAEVVFYKRRLGDQEQYRGHGEHGRDLVLPYVLAELGEVEPLHPVARPAEVAVVHEVGLDARDVRSWYMG